LPEVEALDYSVRAQSQDVYEVDVTGCRYAQFYKELGEPELGFLLVCSQDFTFAEGLGPQDDTISQAGAAALKETTGTGSAR